MTKILGTFLALCLGIEISGSDVFVSDWSYYSNDEVLGWNLEGFEFSRNICSLKFSPSQDSLIECQRKFQSYVKLFGFSNYSSVRMDKYLPINEKSERKQESVIEKKFPLKSTFSVSLKDSYPWPQRWGSCQWCSMDDGLILLHNPDKYSLKESFDTIYGETDQILMGSFRLRGFDPDLTTRNEIRAKFVTDIFEPDNCAYFIEKPVFLIYSWSWGVGHFIVDVLEPLHHTMMAAFGFINTDVYLVLGALPSEEEEQFGMMLEAFNTDTIFRLIHSYTIHPLFTMFALKSLPGRVCFSQGIYTELDISHSYYAHGYDFHPSFFNITKTSEATVAKKYKKFRKFIHSNLKSKNHRNEHTTPEESSKLVITFIERLGGRQLINSGDVKDTIQQTISTLQDFERDSLLVTAALEEIPFSEQLDLFKTTSVLVAQFGSGVHNLMFMQPGSAIVLLMMPGWCDWSWIYVNQAILNGVHAFIYCEHAWFRNLSSFHAHNNGWKEGPESTKNCPLYLEDLETFRVLLQEAIKATDKSIHNHPKDNVPYISNQKLLFGTTKISYIETDAFAWVSMTRCHSGVFPHIYTTVSPLILIEMFPNIGICFRIFNYEDLNPDLQCMQLRYLGIQSHFGFPDYEAESHGSVMFLHSWLVDWSTGEVLPFSHTILPLFFGPTSQTTSPFKSLHGSKKRKDKILILNINLSGSNVELILDFSDEGLLQHIISSFCRKHNLDVMKCGTLSVKIYELLNFSDLELFNSSVIGLDID